MDLQKEKTAEAVGAARQFPVSDDTKLFGKPSVTNVREKDKNYFSVVDGETLMTQPLAPIRFFISSLLPQGLHILAGAPKIGKSWLALWLCLQVAEGEVVWNYQTVRSTTLYLCLEDSYSRIQSRLFDITDDAPPNVYFSIMANGIGNGLEEQIRNFIAEHPDTSLIVIDTLQKVRSLSNDNAYASDYRELGILKTLADKLGIAILLIHHLRKQFDDDPMNMVSGTTAITGAVDSSFVLKQDKRGSNNAVLICDGRDIEYRELKLTFDKSTHTWQLLSDSIEHPESKLDRTISLISDFIKKQKSFFGTPAELAKALQPYNEEKIIPNVLSKKLLQNSLELEKKGIRYSSRRSNGKRLITLEYHDESADSDDKNGSTPCPKSVDPAVTADPIFNAANELSG
jgi:hypothetical protein